MGDPDADFYRCDWEEAELLKRLPVCGSCKRPIQDEKLLYVEGYFYHVDCFVKEYAEDTEDFI
jgi:hypothetical protein